MLRASVVPADSQISARILRTGGRWITSVVVIVAVLSAGVSVTPSAFADSEANLRSAVESARAGTSCGPFRSIPVVEQVAEKINQSTEAWMDHTATQVPIEDPLPGLKILGYSGTKAKLLEGASQAVGNAISDLLLEGYAALPDCSYTDFGASTRRDETSGYYLVAVVLAGA